MKNLIVTGCSNGIGEYLLRHMDLKEYSIFGIDRIPCHYRNTFQMDLTDERLLKKRIKNFPEQLHGIINVAGVCLRRNTVETLDSMYNNNARSMYNMCKVFFPNVQRTKGCIINISSIHARSTLKQYGVYAGSKGMVEALTRGLAIEYAPFDVRVNCIRLGPVKTKMLPYDLNRVKDIPLKRLVSKDDIVSTVDMLLNNKSMTGSVLTLDCGILSKLGVDM